MIRILKSYNLIVPFFVILISCNSKSPRTSNSENDITQIIQILIDSTIKLPRLSDLDRLYKNNPFNNSIIIKNDSNINRNFPTKYKVKFLTGNEICTLAQQYKDSSDFPNYLEFKIWKGEDSVYYASVTNIKIENKNNCLLAINDGCLKLMTLKRNGKGWDSKIEPTLYDR
jgi:hypothetical protein